MSLNLPTGDQELYQNLLTLAGARRLCIVGGYVRDLLLGIPTKDLDLVIERELKEFLELTVSEFAQSFGVAISTIYSRFFTAKLNFNNPLFGYSTLDFSQARKESYPAPASRPVVLEGTLEEDILRRDFTINSIAICRGEFLDLSNGRRDLDSKLIRIHHNNSFRDDPIRLVRAIRFATRLNFSLESNTASRFEDAKKESYLALVSPRRRFEELRKVLIEPCREEILVRLQRAGLLKVLCPAIVSNLPGLPVELEFEDALLKLVEGESLEWVQYVDSLGLPKLESRRLKS